MKRLNKFIFLFLAFIFVIPFLSAVNHVPKKVECSVEIMPNYLWHIFAMSNIWEKKENKYYEKYKGAFSREDIDFLFENRSLIAWGNGRTGKFSALLFFVPLSSEITYKEYYGYLNVLEECVKENNLTKLSDKYVTQGFQRQIINNYCFSKEEIIILSRTCNIIRKNYQSYKNNVWPAIKSILDKEKTAIDSEFSDKDIIGLWENALKLKYKGNKFFLVLTYANAVDNLPSANDLSDARDNFGASGLNTKYLTDLAIHEIGIYIIKPIIISLYSDPVLQMEYISKNNLIYQAFESYIEYKMDIIFKNNSFNKQSDMFGGGKLDISWFCSYYKENDNNEDVHILLRNAIIEYWKKHSNIK